MSFLDIIKLILPLLILVGLLYIFLLFVKKFQFRTNPLILSNIKIVYTLMLMPKKYLSFVRINDTILVLAVSDNNISLVKEFNSNQFEIKDNTPDEPLKFSDHLKSFIKR